MSYAQNIFTTTSPNETNFVITWTPPYYMTTSDVKAEVDKVAWTVVSVSGTNVTLATGIPVDSTVRIYRETDVSSNEVTFLAGSPFRAGDVNQNFDQTLFAVQEALTSDENHENDIDRLEGLIDTILALLNNNIQFVQVANVAALDTVAATDPENLKGYEVVDSTGLEGANPEIPLMPPKAGTGTGEDPVTGVYWDSGISTKVLWDKANQNWIYVSYFASNGDNRYQQITLQQATTPNVDDFKNGTLWFNTTDQNLYVLYDDSSTRSWVLVGPLRDDRYVNRTGDSMTGTLSIGVNETQLFTDGTASFSGGKAIFNTSGDLNLNSHTIDLFATTGNAEFSGNLGIGETNPGHKLEVKESSGNSIARFTGANTAQLEFKNATTNVFEINALATGELSLGTGGTSDQMRIDSSGNVGIGKTTLNTTFEIYNATQPYIYLQNSTTGTGASDGFSILEFGLDAYINNREAGNMLFYNNGSERMRIDSSGKVGIGASSPDGNIHIADSAKTNLILKKTGLNDLANSSLHSTYDVMQFGAGGSLTSYNVETATADTQIGHNFYRHSGGTYKYKYTDAAARIKFNSTQGAILFEHAGSGSANADISFSESMRIDSAGRIQTGGSTAGVASLNLYSSTLGTAVLFQNPNTGTGSGQGGFVGNWGGNTMYLWNYENYPVVFGTNNTEAMRILNSGNVGIGSTDPTGDGWSAANDLVINSTGNSGMTIKSGTSSFGQLVFNDAAGGLRGFIAYGHSDDYLGFGTSGAERMRIDTSGNVTVGPFNTSSDTDGVFLGGTGGIVSQRNSAFGASATIFAGYYGTTNTSAINVDGSAVFGQAPNNTNVTGVGILDAGGAIAVQASGKLFRGHAYSNGAETSAITDAGEATFVSTVNAGGVNVGNTAILLYGNGQGVFTGSVTASSYVTSSDQRFKENITNANSQLADVTALGNRLRNWDWTDDSPVADKDTRFLGLIAQEAEEVCPGIVKTIPRTKQGKELTPETTDEEGNVTPATYEELDDSYKGISQDALIMKLLGAVAELSDKVATLEAG